MCFRQAGHWTLRRRPRASHRESPQDLHWRGRQTRCARCSGCDLLSSGGLPVLRRPRFPGVFRSAAVMAHRRTPAVRFFEVQAPSSCRSVRDIQPDAESRGGRASSGANATALTGGSSPFRNGGIAGTGTAPPPDFMAISATCHRGSPVPPRMPCSPRRLGYPRTGR